jgi:hypothetical protein
MEMTFYNSNVHNIEEILKLVEFVPISNSITNTGKFAEGATMDSELYFKSLNRKGSFRFIVRMLNAELSNTDINWQNVLFFKRRYIQLHEIGCSYPIEYLLFDFCLAALENDTVDAELYLSHSLHILGLNKYLNLLLSIIVSEQLTHDADIRQLLTLLAHRFEPRNANMYTNSYSEGYRNRYEIYKEELQKLV